MWIAKPINALSAQEKQQWVRIAEGGLPLSQTLRWAQAATSVGARAWLIFSPDEKVGGTVLELGEPGVLECINGPFLDWENADQISRQIATFAISASKVSPSFRSLRLLPRWNLEKAENLLKYVPIPPKASVEASTMIVTLNENENQLFEKFHPRLKRTLKTAIKEKASAEWCTPTQDQILSFVDSMKEFAKGRSFYVPNLKWFHQILTDSVETEKVEFGLVKSQIQDGQAYAEILICIFGNMAHYLFGWEKRSLAARAAWSPSAWAHYRAMLEVRARGAVYYDFNGYIKNVALDDPYAGVCKFKEQWGGKVETFFQPEYFIE